MRALAIVDGEHYPPVVRDALRDIPYDVVAAVLVGGSEKLRGGEEYGVPLAFDSSRTYVGWTLGGGVEWAFWNSWSAKVEYLYADFGRGPVVPLAPTVNLTTGRLTDHIGRVGVNYHW